MAAQSHQRECGAAIATTEPGAGSDLQGIRTTAVRCGSHCVINGSKTFISNGSHCDLLIIASLCAGLAESAVLEAIRCTKHREAFGKSLIKFQHNRFELAQLNAETLSIKTTVDHCIQRYIDGNIEPAIASMAKLIAADRRSTSSTGACNSSVATAT